MVMYFSEKLCKEDKLYNELMAIYSIFCGKNYYFFPTQYLVTSSMKGNTETVISSCIAQVEQRRFSD